MRWMKRLQYDGNQLNDQISYAANIISDVIVEPRLSFTSMYDSASMT